MQNKGKRNKEKKKKERKKERSKERNKKRKKERQKEEKRTKGRKWSAVEALLPCFSRYRRSFWKNKVTKLLLQTTSFLSFFFFLSIFFSSFLFLFLSSFLFSSFLYFFFLCSAYSIVLYLTLPISLQVGILHRWMGEGCMKGVTPPHQHCHCCLKCG